MLLGVRREQCLKCLAHRFAFIQVHAQVALWFGQGKQARRDLVGLLVLACVVQRHQQLGQDRKSTRLNSSHMSISYAVFCLKKKKKKYTKIKRNNKTKKLKQKIYKIKAK